jgi:Reverse transcriptase (RNA-dependent DNA polymerase)
MLPITPDSAPKDAIDLLISKFQNLQVATYHEQLQHSLGLLQHHKARHQDRKKHTLFNSYRGTHPASTRTFFGRFSQRYNSFGPISLGSHPDLTRDDLANQIRTDWQPILNGKRPKIPHSDLLQMQAPRLKLTPATAPHLMAPIQTTEVIRAIKKCGYHSAAGPDTLSNRWYKSHSEILTQCLEHLYNSCITDGQFPRSFTESFIFCIPKHRDTQTGLDFRPIALLNSDYKILTRILAWRLKPYLPDLISSTQTGFVPGRLIHETIDNIMHVVRTQPSDSDQTILMLDFAKAYDTLDRGYLWRTLSWHGLPTGFVHTLSLLHHQTTGRFLVNGFQSQPISIKNGIRQGCPLAPLLFILALEPLY